MKGVKYAKDFHQKTFCINIFENFSTNTRIQSPHPAQYADINRLLTGKNKIRWGLCVYLERKSKSE